MALSVTPEIFALSDDHTRYRYNLMELNNEWDQMVEQIDMLLSTKPGELMDHPDFGINLEKYLFQIGMPGETIAAEVSTAIGYWIVAPPGTKISVTCNTRTIEGEVIGVIDIMVNGQQLTRYVLK